MEARENLDAHRAVQDSVALILRHHLDDMPAGTWVEYRDPKMQPTADKIPSSSFYHLVLAFATVLEAERRRAAPHRP